MATIYRALLTAALLLFGYAAWTSHELPSHLQVGLVAAIFASLVHSLPFAYFLGTGFWVKAFVRASSAGPEWEARHKRWMKGRAYPAMYLAPLCTLATGISGGLVETGRIGSWWHPVLAAAAAITSLVNWWAVPREMRRNSALMDELAERHQPPRPGTKAMEQLVAREEAAALPPLFQLSRLLLFAGAQTLIVWLYLRFGTEGWRETPFWPFGVAFCALLTLGLGLNARHDPEKPAAAPLAWGRALAVGGACAVALGLAL